MPYVKIQTNQTPTDADAARISEKASAFAAAELGKPERSVMVALETGVTMRYAGSDAPCAYLEVKSIGLAEQAIETLSASFCDFCAAELAVAPDRVFIRFEAPPGAWWGWNRRTF
ncbi:MAG TPA: phenylpyruvate tautomerase MIF-related protein [Spirochaetota bacterium]|nr:phenylpyruvate tautomerase MIF-related protein [Spirochaetota bacterium]